MKRVITGMGRSGTKWLSEFLEIQHEPRPGESVDINIDINKIVNKMSENHIEVNSHLRTYSYELKKLNVQVYFLARNPLSTISSTFNSLYSDKKNISRDEFVYNLENLVLHYKYISESLLNNCINVFVFENIINEYSFSRNMCYHLDINSDYNRWKKYRELKINSTLEKNKKVTSKNKILKDLLKNHCKDVIKELGYSI